VYCLEEGCVGFHSCVVLSRSFVLRDKLSEDHNLKQTDFEPDGQHVSKLYLD